MMSEQNKARSAGLDTTLSKLATKEDMREMFARIKFWILSAALVVTLVASSWLDYTTSRMNTAPIAPPVIEQPQIIIIVYPVPANQPVPPPRRL